MNLKALIISMRPRHWIKNSLLFFPILFAGRIDNIETLEYVFYGFLAFCFMASSIYLINDVFDIEIDKRHFKKKKRPIASGQVSKNTVLLAALVLFVFSLVISWWLSIHFLVIILLYFVINLAYNLGLKQISLVDISIVAFGFSLRILAGGILASVIVSHWLILISFLLALFLALGKRRYELISDTQLGDQVGKLGYTPAFIDYSLTLFGSATFVIYILYTISPDVTSRIGSEYIYLTCLPVLFGLLRYLQILIVFEKDADPVEVLLQDRFLIITTITWLVLFASLLYI